MGIKNINLNTSNREVLESRQKSPRYHPKSDRSNSILKERQENSPEFDGQISKERRFRGRLPGVANFLSKDWMKEAEIENMFQRTEPITREVVGTAEKFVNDIASYKPLSAIATSNLNKLWRAKILINRTKGAKNKAAIDLKEARRKASSYKSPVKTPPASPKSEAEISAEIQKKITEASKNPISTQVTLKQDQLRIWEIQRKEANNQIVIYNMGGSKIVGITLQTRPHELKVEPHSSWASVKSMGRNNPFMMYTGGEDTITLDISWYSNDKDRRDDVINKCRLLESWTRADGYSAPPPVLKIRWGSSDLFARDTFILESAQYTLNNFQDAVRKNNKEITNLKLYPQYATQTLVFKRVSSYNRGRNNIVSIKDLQNITGIDLNYSPSTSVNI